MELGKATFLTIKGRNKIEVEKDVYKMKINENYIVLEPIRLVFSINPFGLYWKCFLFKPLNFEIKWNKI